MLIPNIFRRLGDFIRTIDKFKGLRLIGYTQFYPMSIGSISILMSNLTKKEAVLPIPTATWSFFTQIVTLSGNIIYLFNLLFKI